jgi:hypothetical protein
MANNNQIYKMSNAGGFKSLTRYHDMLAGNPVFVVPFAYDSIETVTVGSTAQSSISFTSIPATYKHLQIRAFNRCSVNSGRLRFQFNGDTAANYSGHYILGTGASALAGGAANSSRLDGAYNNATASVFSVDIIDILEYANTNTYKTMRNLSGVDTNTVNGEVFYASGNWRSTSAVTSISMFFDSGNITQYSSFALYGIRG